MGSDYKKGCGLVTLQEAIKLKEFGYEFPARNVYNLSDGLLYRQLDSCNWNEGHDGELVSAPFVLDANNWCIFYDIDFKTLTKINK